ncbi:MAG: metalloregulator ArsR/SmtB family transcription factor [Nocardioides sp.]
MDCFTALADDVRRALLLRLAAGPARVVDLAADHAISRPAISRHLRVLGEAGLVTVEQRGRERHYALDRAGLVPVRRLLADLAMPVHLNPRVLDGLDLEVRRTVRERTTTTSTTSTTSTEETA